MARDIKYNRLDNVMMPSGLVYFESINLELRKKCRSMMIAISYILSLPQGLPSIWYLKYLSSFFQIEYEKFGFDLK